MASLIKWGRQLLWRPLSPPRRFTSTAVSILDPTKELEEETLPAYAASQFYPVRVGEVFNGKYQALGKLGYGGYSTVWLARDLQYNSYKHSFS